MKKLLLVASLGLVLTGCSGLLMKDTKTSELLQKQQEIVNQQSDQIKELTDNVNKLIEEKNRATEEAAKTAPAPATQKTAATSKPAEKKIEPFPTLEKCDIASEEKEGSISLSKFMACNDKRIEYENKKTEWYAKYGQAIQIDNR